MPQFETKVKVTNLHELKMAIIPFLPSSQSTVRKLLLDGFTAVDRLNKFKDAQATAMEAFAGSKFKPANSFTDLDALHINIDTLIMNRMDGKRKGKNIIWHLKEGNFEFNPFTGVLINTDTNKVA